MGLEVTLVSNYPPVEAPEGRCVTVDERLLTEGGMFRYGYEGVSEQEIAEEYEVSVLWLLAVWKSEQWLEKAYDAGVEARGRSERRSAEAELYRMARKDVTWKEQINKQTGEVVRLESEVRPSLPAVEKILENRDPTRWGKKVDGDKATVTNVYIQQAQVKLGERKAELDRMQREAIEYGG